MHFQMFIFHSILKQLTTQHAEWDLVLVNSLSVVRMGAEKNGYTNQRLSIDTPPGLELGVLLYFLLYIPSTFSEFSKSSTMNTNYFCNE